eukprot:gnl/Spiro4/5356_TR2721_c0_g3_i1.p1 gnl/Spiro4/5356_TR2721_c0_g3~~gnl/Spiro4/5356_TR2721_c0_g3_i1.p1  ORF type:complete len:176 (-),score=63.68 gnl/Spiro4/5356_TR2721_c0_g3_i1:91-618(-)
MARYTRFVHAPTIQTPENVACKLYVGNLDLRITEGQLVKLFKPFGKIVREDFIWHTQGHQRGAPRGFAFVEYATREDAQRAVAELNGKLVLSRPIVVRFCNERDKPVAGPDAAPASRPQRHNFNSTDAKIAAIRSKLGLMKRENAAATTTTASTSTTKSSASDVAPTSTSTSSSH